MTWSGRVRAGPGRAGARDADGVHDMPEAEAVVDVAAGQDEAEGAAAPVAGEVDLGAQSTAGSAEGVITRIVPVDRPPFPARRVLVDPHDRGIDRHQPVDVTGRILLRLAR